MNKRDVFIGIGGCILGVVLGSTFVAEHHRSSKTSFTKSFTYNQSILMNDQSNYLINEQLETLLKFHPDAARVRVGIVHSNDNEARIDKIPLMRFDVTNVRAASGKNPGITESDLPLSQWGDYLPRLMSGHCARILLSEMKEDAAIARFNKLNASGFISCPITRDNGNLLGGVFMYWDYPDLPPEDINAVEQDLKTAAMKIQLAIDIRIDDKYR